MKKYILLLLLPAMIISCKKNKQEEQQEVTDKVKTVTAASGSIYTYSYDAQGKVTRIDITNGGYTEYAYGANLVTENIYTASGSVDDIVEYHLDAAGLIDLIITTGPFPEGPYDYTFNSMKQVESIAYRDGIGGPVLQSDHYYYTGQVLDSILSKDQLNNVTRRELREYYTDIDNTITTKHKGQAYYGVQSPKALKKRTIIFYSGSGNILNTQIGNFTYETDAEGRITREVMTSNTTAAADNRYTYY